MYLATGLVALALAAADGAASAQRVVPVSISKPQGPAALRRRATYTETLSNNVSDGSYIASVQVGTPAQTVQLAIDTGSSDLWVLASNSDLCSSQRLQGEYGPCLTPFNSGHSSTYKIISTNSFKASYADGTSATGNYFSDNAGIGGANITGLQMGIATKSEIPMGLLGIGFDTNEATTGGQVYPNLVDAMVSSGAIAAKAYSLYLNDIQSQTGTILFGGIDTKKYIGSLKAVPIEPNKGNQYIDFTVALSKLSGTSGGGNSTTYSSTATPVVLDSGTTLVYLPDDAAQGIYQQFGAYDDTQNSGFVFVNCNYLTSDPKFAFNFQFGGSDGPTINVPIDQVIQNDVQQFIGGSDGLQLPSGLGYPASQACSFGIQGGGGEVNLLGDTFLRNAYAVYDLDNHEIALGQANFNSTESNVVEIGGGSSAIPDVSGVASQVTVEQSATGLPGPGGRSTGTAMATGGGGGSSGSGATTTASGTAGATSSNSAAGLRPPSASFEFAAVAAVAGVFALFGGALVVL